MRKKIQYLLIFFILSATLTLSLWYEKEHKIDNYYQEHTNEMQLKYEALYNGYNKDAQLLFETLIDKPEIIDTLASVYDKNSEQKDVARDKLYTMLEDDYKIIQRYDVRQLHFHLKNNRSFLRFHKPKLFGDNLTAIRSSVVYTNENKKTFDGFEEGRIYNGYRFVFPILREKEHIGSVEISFSSLAFSKNFIKNYKVFANFLILEDVITKKVMEEELDNYKESNIEGYYTEKALYEFLNKNYPLQLDATFDKQVQRYITARLSQKKPFSVYNKDSKNITTFIPLTHNISKEVVAALCVKSDATYIQNKELNFIIVSLIGSTAIGIIVLFLYKDRVNKIRIKKDTTTLQTIFEEVDSGIGLLDANGNFLKVNNKFAQLLHYNPGELLLQSYSDIVETKNKQKLLEALKVTQKKGLLSRMTNRYITKEGKKQHFETSLRYMPHDKMFIIVINLIEDRLQLEELNDILDAKVKQQVRKIRIQDDIMLKQNRLAAIGEMVNAITTIWQDPLRELKRRLKNLKTATTAMIKNEEIKSDFEDNIQTLSYLEESIVDFSAFFETSAKKENFSVKEAINNSLLKKVTNLAYYDIALELEGEDFVIYGNEAQFLQIMLNLINNSKDAIISRDLDKGKITITLEDGQVIVSDNAKGIPEHIFAKVFEPYVTTKIEGTGIGLYMVKQLVKSMGGRIDVKNSHYGAKFIITFSQAS
ncbi:MAG: ATP-binding protein [Campylobacterota bacterium]